MKRAWVQVLCGVLMVACKAAPPPAAASGVSATDGSAAGPAHGDAGHAHGGHGDAGHAHGGHGGSGHAHGFADPARYAPAWNDPGRDAWQKPAEILAALGVGPGATVVDLGAGTGYLTPHLSGHVGPDGAVIAADVEPAMLAFLQEAAAAEGWGNVRTHQAAYDALGLPPGTADAVVTLNVWHHIEDRAAYARRLAEVLKPGAAFVVVDFLKAETEGFGPPLAMRLSAEEVVAELSAGGLQAEILPETMPRHYVVRGVRPTAP